MKKKLLAAALLLALLSVCACASQESKLEDENLKIARSYRTMFRAAEKGEEMNVHLSDETVDAIVGTLVGSGYAAADMTGQNVVGNAQLITGFAASDAAGAQSQVSLFFVCPDGGFFRYDLSTGAGGRQCTLSRVYWNGSTPEQTYVRSFAVAGFELTDGGYFIFDTPEEYVFVRVETPDAELESLCEKYVSPLGYGGMNLFTTDWGRGSFDHVDLNALFYRLWQRDNTASFSTAFETSADGMTAYVPAQEFESAITASVDISVQQLRLAAGYLQEKQAYPVHVVSETDELFFETDYTPQVRAAAENADGSLTITVSAMSAALGTDCAFTHELTVLPQNDGFVYVGNRVLHTEGEVIPEYVNLLELTGAA